MKTKNYVRLSIISNSFDLQMLNEMAGMQCDQGWRVGDKRSVTTILEVDNGWVINSGLSPEVEVELQLCALFKRVEPIKEKIKELSKSCYVEIACALYSDEVPALHFDKEIIKQVDELGACLDIDLYIMGPD